MSFPLRDLSILHRPEGFHKCDQDSTVWIHFCLFEILMWWISVFSSCISGSVGEEERRASLSIMSRLPVSVRLGIMLGMWCFAEVLRIFLEHELARAAGGRWPQKSERFLRFTCVRSQSAFFRLVNVR